MALDRLFFFLSVLSLISVSSAHANSLAENHIFANAALRNLHEMASATAEYDQATRDSDDYGCDNAYSGMQKAAHDALVDMHSMSFAPRDAIDDVSKVLRISHFVPGGCSNDMFADSELMFVGQAVMALRYDYAIGDQDWYSIAKSGKVVAKNPLQYAESLRDRGYSAVGVRPKDMIFLVETDWKAEMASDQVDDPSIEHSGKSLNAVEVDYRRNPETDAIVVYFYRTKAAAVAATQASKRRAAAKARAVVQLKGSIAAWRRKLFSIPYLIADRDSGFKVIFDACKDTGKKDADGFAICSDEASYDWSGGRALPYRWFGTVDACEQKEVELGRKKPANVKASRDEEFMTVCVPASKPVGMTKIGYKLIFALIAPGATDEDASYAELRRSELVGVKVFHTFKACDNAMSALYPKLLGDLGVDKDGAVIGNETKSIDLTANCVRAY